MIVLFLTQPLLQAQSVSINGTKYGHLKQVGQTIGLKTKVLVAQSSVAWQGQGREAVFQVHKRDVHINGTRVYIGSPIAYQKGSFYVSEQDVQKTLQPILAPWHSLPICCKQPKRILIDPGHGGKDNGAENIPLGLKEKQLTLALAHKLKALLEQKGYEVFLTRIDDQYVELKQRSAQIKTYCADLFISLHFNAAQAQEAQGIETYILTPQHQFSTGRSKLDREDAHAQPGNQFDIQNAWLGYAIQNTLSKRFGALADRGLRRARFAVLRELSCPGVLIEGGFLTHPDEAKRLKNPAHLDRLAQGIATGIQTYADGIQRLCR